MPTVGQFATEVPLVAHRIKTSSSYKYVAVTGYWTTMGLTVKFGEGAGEGAPINGEFITDDEIYSDVAGCINAAKADIIIMLKLVHMMLFLSFFLS
jgi:hypothetical protein